MNGRLATLPLPKKRTYCVGAEVTTIDAAALVTNEGTAVQEAGRM